MAKKSMIARETKRQKLVQKYAAKRSQFKQELRDATSIREVVLIHRQFQGLPRNSSPVRLHNRCAKTCLLYTSPSPRDLSTSRMPSSA